jgi:salicylate hydroxylase
VLSVGIAGAGIGGLTLALACRHAGLDDITVYEQAGEPESAGAGLQLSPNASRVLCALGLRAALEEIGFHPQAVHLRTWRTSYLIASRPLGAFSEARYGAPYYHVHRGDLRQMLLDAVNRQGVRVESGQACRGADQDGAGAWLEFDEGRRRHDAVIGCDGIHSAVRDSLFDAAAPRFTGHVAWRGLIPTRDLPPGLVSPNATVWLGPRRHFVNYYVRGGELVNFVGVVETDRWTEESWRQRGDVADLAADFAGWHPLVQTLIAAAKDVYRWALYDRDPMPAWSRGNITLLGDACHPMLPYLAQGAAMAIEDAWVLARMLERWEDEPAQGIVEYERYRRPRTARVQTSSRAQGVEFHLEEGRAVWRRNLKLALGSRFLPEMAMQQFDWLHGYDCIRGFE